MEVTSVRIHFVFIVNIDTPEVVTISPWLEPGRSGHYQLHLAKLQSHRASIHRTNVSSTNKTSTSLPKLSPDLFISVESFSSSFSPTFLLWMHKNFIIPFLLHDYKLCLQNVEQGNLRAKSMNRFYRRSEHVGKKPNTKLYKKQKNHFSKLQDP